jgi:hypothetical protein
MVWNSSLLGVRIPVVPRAVVLEWFTVGWNVVEALVAVGAGLLSGSVALIGFGFDSGIEVISAVGLIWRLRTSADAPKDEETAAERRARAAPLPK